MEPSQSSNAEEPCPDDMGLASTISKQYRRYRRIAERHLPKWAPAGVTLSFISALSTLYGARRARRNADTFDDDTPSIYAELQSHRAEQHTYVEAEIACLVRLCTYSNEMQKVWRTISTMPAQGCEDPAFTICDQISITLGRFDQIPKRLPAQRKKSLLRVAKAVDDLLKAVESDSEAQYFSEGALIEYLVVQNLKMRFDGGEQISGRETRDPSWAFKRTIFEPRYAGFVDDSPPSLKPWDQWPVLEKYEWLHEEISVTGMPELLTFYRDGLTILAQEQPEIRQPGRPDGGLQPFLIRSLSSVMRRIYGKPLDDVVAMLVSATLDLPEPLTREEIRPYLKGTGKNSSRNR